MSRGHDLKVTVPSTRFNDLTKVVNGFNKHVDKVNAGLKKKKYDKVTRYPDQQTGEDYRRGLVVVRIEIKDRARTLFQELVTRLERFESYSNMIEERAQTRVHRGSNPGVWIPCQSEEEAKVVAKVLNSISGNARVEFI